MARQKKGAGEGSSSKAGRFWVDLAAWQIGTVLVVVGAACIALAQIDHEPTWVATTVRELGAVLVATGVLAVAWDLRGRRALTMELLEAVDLASEVRLAGLRRLGRGYLASIEWEALFEATSQVDLFFTYAQTWRNTHATALRQLVTREGTRLRVVLPNPQDEALMRSLAAKFRYSATDLSQRVNDAAADVLNLARQASPTATVELRYTTEFPVFASYRFGRSCVVTLYAQAPGRVDVPVLQCEQGGFLFAFFRDQFEALWEHSVRHTEHNDDDANDR